MCISGYLYDITGDFNTSFYAIGVVGLIAGTLAVIVTYRYHRRGNHNTMSENKSPAECCHQEEERKDPAQIMADDIGLHVVVKSASRITS